MTNLSVLRSCVGAAALFLTGLAPTAAEAASFSFLGNISRDDEVQLFNFTVGSTSNVILKTLSWAGGVNADGAVIAAGGFDPILAVFGPDGTKIESGSNDDGDSSTVSVNSGRYFDTYLALSNLAAGTYTVAVSQYDNSAGTTLSDPFTRQGQGNFTGNAFGCGESITFCASGALARDSHWAFDILGVVVASNPTGGNGNGNGNGNPGDVPLPAAFFLFGGALAGFGGLSRMKRKKG